MIVVAVYLSYLRERILPQFRPEKAHEKIARRTDDVVDANGGRFRSQFELVFQFQRGRKEPGQ